MQYYRGMETKKKERKEAKEEKRQKDKPDEKKGNLARIGCQNKESQKIQVAWYTQVCEAGKLASRLAELGQVPNPP